jgi:stringent starvation protein B
MQRIKMTSTRPYLLRALYDWIVDNNCTPYVLVNAEFSDVEVPREFVENGKVVLNISPQAVQGLLLENEWVNFNARFSGRSLSVLFPVKAVLAIYAKENGKGMFFQPDADEGSPPSDPPPSPPAPTSPPPRTKPTLKRVK